MTLDETAKEEYDERFIEEDRFFLCRRGIPPLQANEYHPRFSAPEIGIFVNRGQSAKEVNAYDSHFDVRDIFGLTERSISPQIANKFNRRFKGVEIDCLVRNEISPEEADQYDQRFFGFDIEALSTVGISPTEANSYRRTYDGEDIRKLHILGIKYRKMSEEEERKLLEGYSRLYDEEYLARDKVLGGYCYFRLRGTGASGGVLSWDGLAWKFSLEIDTEYALLMRNHEFHKREQRNTLKVKGPIRQSIVAMVEYIPGRSLEGILTDGRAEDHQRVVQYSFGIFNGLLELRAAGIYHHRDIRPANIMIDKGQDRAVIIDLGIATTDKDALAKDNRRFGSPTGRVANDLNSLGQVMYKMATGEHIFTESKSMERTTYADEVRDRRDWIYEEPERLVPYLQQVERTVAHPTLLEIIRFCLTAGGKDEEYNYLD